MDKNRIPFNEWSKERIKQGRKFCTSRHKKYLNDDRVSFIMPNVPWVIIRTFFWQAEGADSPEELQAVIESIMHRKVPDDERFHVHVGNFEENSTPKGA